MDIFSQLVTYVGLIGMGLVGVVVVSWLLMRLFARMGWYTPTGPIDSRMSRLLLMSVLLLILIGGIGILFFWFSLSPRPLGREPGIITGG